MYFHYIVLRVSTPKIKETYTPKTLHNLSQEGLITCSFSKREESRDLWLFLDLETGGKESKPVTNRDFIVHQNSIVAAVNFEIPVAEILATSIDVFAHKRNASFRSYWFQIRPIYALCIRFPPRPSSRSSSPFRPADSTFFFFFFLLRFLLPFPPPFYRRIFPASSSVSLNATMPFNDDKTGYTVVWI